LRLHSSLRLIFRKSWSPDKIFCLLFLTKCIDVQLQRVHLNGICIIDVIKSLVVAVVKNSEDTIHLKSNNALRKIRIRIYKLPWMFVQSILDNNLRDTCPLRAGHQLRRDVAESNEAISRVKRASS